MPWTDIAPVVKTTGRPMVSANVAVLKDGSAKIWLNLADSLLKDLGDPTHAAVMIGTEEDAGLLRIEFRDDGAFDLKPFARGGARIAVPSVEGLPAKAAATETCRMVAQEKGAIVVALPLDLWNREALARAPRPAPAPNALREVGADAVKLTNGKLDVVEYLKPKGEAIERLAGGRFQLNGETVTMSAVLLVVNAKRKQADLEPLALGAVF